MFIYFIYLLIYFIYLFIYLILCCVFLTSNSAEGFAVPSRPSSHRPNNAGYGILIVLSLQIETILRVIPHQTVWIAQMQYFPLAR